LGLGVLCSLAALDDLGGDFDPGALRVDVAARAGGADEADGRKQRALGREALLDEGFELLRAEADLELEEARAGAHLLQRAVDAVVVRRRARVLDRAEEEV